MALLFYVATAALWFFAARRVAPLTNWIAAVILLLPLCLTGRALFTGSVYGPLDLAFGGEPLVAIGDKVGVRDVMNPAISDVYTEFFPWNDALRRAIARHEWPLWNPYELCGTPLAGAAQSAPYHPVTVIGYLVPLRQYFAFAAAMLYLTAALSAFLFARELVESEIAALFAAAAWMFSSHLVFYAGTALAHAVAVTPLVLLGARRVVRTPGAKSIAILTIALLLVVLAGHPESALHVISFGAAYAIYQLFIARPDFRRAISAGLAAGAITLLLSAFFLLPHIEAILQSEEYVHRALGYRQSVSTPAQMLHRLRANAFPFLEGSPGIEEVRHAPELKHGWLATAYAGSLVLALAMAGMFTLRERWFFIGAVLVGLAAGIGAPGVTNLLRLLPGFSIAINDRMIAFAALGLCVLAAGAIDKPCHSEPRKTARNPQPRYCAGDLSPSSRLEMTHRSYVMGGLALVTLAAIAFAPPDLPRDFLWLGAARAVVPLILGAIAMFALKPRPAMLVLLALLLVQRVGETSRVQPTVPASAFYPPFPGVEVMRSSEPFRITALGTMLPPAISTHYGLEDVRGFQAVTFARYDATYPLWCVRQPVWFNRVDQLTSPFLSMMNVRFAIVPHAQPLPSNWIPRAQFPSYDIVENQSVLPRAFVPRMIHLVRDAKEHLAQTADFMEESWIESDQTATRANGPGTVTNRLHARMQREGWVIISIAAWKGWQARIDGKPADIHFANHAFIGIFVPAGDHDIALNYRPRSFVIGSWISGVTALLLIGLRLRFPGRT